MNIYYKHKLMCTLMRFISNVIHKNKHKLKHMLIRGLLVLLYLLILFLGGCEKKEDVVNKIVDTRVQVTINDLSAPIISSTSDTFNVNIGSTFFLQNEVTVVDNMDGILAYECQDTFDLNKAGQYTLKISASDKSGNVASRNVTINVIDNVEHIKPVAPTQKEEPIISQQQDKPANQEITSKRYLMVDGFTNATASEQCRNDLFASGRSGKCDAIMDSNGICLGMQLILQ